MQDRHQYFCTLVNALHLTIFCVQYNIPRSASFSTMICPNVLCISANASVIVVLSEDSEAAKRSLMELIAKTIAELSQESAIDLVWYVRREPRCACLSFIFCLFYRQISGHPYSSKGKSALIIRADCSAISRDFAVVYDDVAESLFQLRNP